ncbi:MAG: hypothetical protein RJA44_2644 [Pseudomonadota bacterium]|jgi:hypothetical protein
MQQRRSLQLLWLAILATLLHAFVPALHALLQPESLYGAICGTSLGSSAATDDHVEPDTNPAGLTPRQCPLCLSGAHHLGGTPAPAALPARSDLAHAAPLTPGHAPPALRPARQPANRDPPRLS